MVVAGEIELGLVSADAHGGVVVGACGIFGSGEGAEPHAHTLAWVPYFRSPLAPRPSPDSSVGGLPYSRLTLLCNGSFVLHLLTWVLHCIKVNNNHGVKKIPKIIVSEKKKKKKVLVTFVVCGVRWLECGRRGGVESVEVREEVLGGGLWSILDIHVYEIRNDRTTTHFDFRESVRKMNRM